MKKLSKISLNKQATTLKKDEMMKILGGGSVWCHCLGVDEATEKESCEKCKDACGGSGQVQNCNYY